MKEIIVPNGPHEFTEICNETSTNYPDNNEDRIETGLDSGQLVAEIIADVKEEGDIQFRVVGNTATPKLGTQNTSELTKSIP